ncbi:MAG: transcriptional repressor [Mobilitalea sp.]
MQRTYKTKSKNRIIEFFKENKGKVVSAAEVHNFLNQENKVDLATIYRNLDKMTVDGLLMKYKDSHEDKAVYQYVEDGDNCHEHLHMQCVKCGDVKHLECDFMMEIKEHLGSHHQFGLQCSKSILYGLCNNCKDEQAVMI